MINLHTVASFARGKYFATFVTRDMQSGVSGYFTRVDGGEWQPATSPYIVPSSPTPYLLFVKALDHAGNERIAQVLIPAQRQEGITFLTVVLVVLGTVVALSALFLRKILYYRK